MCAGVGWMRGCGTWTGVCGSLQLFQEIFRIIFDSYLCSFFEKEDMQ